MCIILFLGAEREIKLKRPYHLGLEEKELVDNVFDEQKSQGRLINCPKSPVGWLVFVIKKEAKWHPIVDLRGLN